jgi:steroid delta-isomerase-like uncharacterized protein
MRCDVPEDDVRRLVREYVTAWNSHDVDRLLSLFAEDGSYGEFSLGRIMLGQEEIRRHLIATFAALPDLTTTPTDEPLGSGQRVFWRWLMTATHQGEYVGIPPTGKRFELRGFSFLLVRGDRIVRAADCFEVEAVVRQVAPERHQCSKDVGETDPSRRLSVLADEDNIAYGE